MKKEFLECGKIVSTHGIKGELKVEPWADSAEFLTGFKEFYLENGNVCLNVMASRTHKNMVLILFDNYDDIDKANTLRGKIIYIKRSDALLNEGDYFWQDLIDMKVYDCENKSICYGKITDISQTGSNDVYYIENDNGEEILVPAIKDVIKSIDLDNNEMLIKPLEELNADEN